MIESLMGEKEIGPLFSEKEPSRPFRIPTGERPIQDIRHPSGSQPVLASRRTERKSRIASDVRRIFMFGIVLVTVGVVLAMLVSMIRGR